MTSRSSEVNFTKNYTLLFLPFITLRLRDHWADVDATWHVYSMDCGKKILVSGISNFDHAPCMGTQNLPQLIPVIPYTALCSCRHAAREQRHYAGFYVAKIPAMYYLTLGNSQHHVRESSQIRRDNAARVGWLFIIYSFFWTITDFCFVGRSWRSDVAAYRQPIWLSDYITEERN